MIRFSTDSVAESERLDYWRDVVCSTFADIDCRALAHTPFRASLENGGLDSIHLCTSITSPVHISKSEELVRHGSHSNFMLCIQQRGICILDQEKRQARLQPGDMALLDSVRPYQVIFPGPAQQLVVYMPRKALLRAFKNAEQSSALRMARSQGTVELLGQFMQGLSSQLFQGSLADTLGEHADPITQSLQEGTLALIAAALSGTTGAAPHSIIKATRYRLLYRAQDYINSQLADPNLTIEDVARHLSISVRRLQQVFKECHVAQPSRYLWQQRLARSKAACDQPQYAQNSISEIALMYGFSDFSHFSRRFKAAYGCTPSEYRNGNGGQTTIYPSEGK